jgi:cytochrome P450
MQAQSMVQYWKTLPNETTDSMAHNVRTLALDVLLAAGFGQSVPFKGTSASKSGALSHRDALAMILENAILVLAIGVKALPKFTFPQKLARLGEAVQVYQSYLTRQIDEEKRLLDEGKPGSGPLITSLVKSAAKEEMLRNDSEVAGNMFVFQFAGHDTTSHTLAYTFMHLAACPEVQSWMIEEIDHVLQDREITKLTYAETFPRLKRTLAVLVCISPTFASGADRVHQYETLRLFDPLLSILKTTGNASATLTLNKKTITVPQNTRVALSMNALHTHPDYWGESATAADLRTWRPSRWIEVAPGDESVFDRESLYTPYKGAFIPFSSGMRECPGKKFAQVEHVAVMTSIFRSNTIEPAVRDGETIEAARQRALNAINNTGMVLLLQMLAPEQVPLKIVPR